MYAHGLSQGDSEGHVFVSQAEALQSAIAEEFMYGQSWEFILYKNIQALNIILYNYK
jgi:hypothetical protein